MANLLRVERKERTGPRVGDRQYFEAEFEGEPTKDDIREAQSRAGYHPNGYGGPQQAVWSCTGVFGDAQNGTLRNRKTTWKARWYCAASCD